MDSLKGRVLDLLRPDIVERLDPQDYVLHYLHKNKFITDVMYRRVNSSHVCAEQCRILILEVKRKEIFDEFIDALKYKRSHLKLAENLVTKLTEIACPRYKEVDKVETISGKTKLLTLMSFRLHMLPTDGDMQNFDKVVTRMKVEHSQNPDVLFRVLDSQTAMYEDLSHCVHSLEKLVPYTTNSEVSAMTFLAWKGSALSMTKKFDQALSVLELAKCKSLMVKPCFDTGRMMYTYTNVLMQMYEAFPNPSNRQLLIRNLKETFAHFAESDPEIKNEFSRIFYLKLAFCHLGLNVHGKVMFEEVSDDDLKAAKFYITKAESLIAKLSKRRKMFILIAKAVLICRSGEGTLDHAICLTEEAKRLAADNGFRKELPYITEFNTTLTHRESESETEDVEENMDVSRYGDEESDMDIS